MSRVKINNKVIVIVGPTASGKTGLAVRLARKFKGEIISADSRQVYQGMDIGTGKDLAIYGQGKNKIKYHLIDVASPQEIFDLAQWLTAAKKALADIVSQGKLPIIVGGTGLYVQALVDGYQLSSARPNFSLRQELGKLNLRQLQERIKKANLVFFNRLNNSEKNNKRRLERYLEILNQGEKNNFKKVKSDYDFLILGITWPKAELKKRIHQRLLTRLEKEGMVEEVKKLHNQGVSWQRLESSGLEYKFIAQYLQEKLNYEEMVKKIEIASRQYAKRQMTWLRRWEKQGATIKWINDFSSLVATTNKFLIEKN